MRPAQVVIDAGHGPGGRGVGHGSGCGYHLRAGPGHVLLRGCQFGHGLVEASATKR